MTQAWRWMTDQMKKVTEPQHIFVTSAENKHT